MGDNIWGTPNINRDYPRGRQSTGELTIGDYKGWSSDGLCLGLSKRERFTTNFSIQGISTEKVV